VSHPATIVEALGMREHPEGGWYAETWRAEASRGERPTGSAILFLLAAGHRSHWHRLDADEVWQYSGGDAVELSVWLEGDAAVTVHRLGPVDGGRADVQAVVPAGAWQSAASLGAWTLVGCIVTPAFEFEGFELATPGWDPPVG
jgi:predicted cupin superfamily sugar epimerase